MRRREVILLSPTEETLRRGKTRPKARAPPDFLVFIRATASLVVALFLVGSPFSPDALLTSSLESAPPIEVRHEKPSTARQHGDLGAVDASRFVSPRRRNAGRGVPVCSAFVRRPAMAGRTKRNGELVFEHYDVRAFSLSHALAAERRRALLLPLPGRRRILRAGPRAGRGL